MPLAAATLQLPGYTVTETLYTGTRTLVYRGRRQRDTMPVVIKLLRQEHPRFSELVQFRYQYTLTKNLDLPTVVKSYSLEPYRNGYALVMEDFGGLSIAAYVKENGQISLEQFWSIALQLTDSLHALYQQHIIHKDIKPANILIHPDTQQIKLIDFSIASLLTRETQASHHPSELEGTLAYLAPEQTGRMNRGVDYRSDFYALGVTFFELLTGRLPFESTDPMTLVHCHLAKYPPLAHTIDPAIPIGLAHLVDKLMAKNAEDRYQSALGLKHDLEQCRSQWTQGSIAPFELGKRDVCDRFLIPEKLYGREPEVAALLAAFERVASIGNGEWGVGSGEDSYPTPDSRLPTPDSRLPTPLRSELILIAGFSGIGKTAVVNEVQKPIVRQRGYFIKGKYDQFQRNIPFSAFVQAFRDLIGQLLSESDVQLEQWKHKLLVALGEHGQVMLEVIPELERLIGQQLPVPALSGDAAQNRFNRLFQQFIQVFAAPEHPLVMFIDDLQWADAASLKLMTLLMNAAETRHLLFIGAYRDHEVTPAHPLMLALEAIRNSNTIVHLITLEPLDQPSVNQLVADTLSCTLEAAAPLAALVMQKTSGNPFFSTQFLKALHEEGQIRFDFARGGWECDIAHVRSLALTDDVVEFMALQLQKLPADTQTVLQLAACIGNQFDLQTLAIVHEAAQPDTAAALWKAIQDGLILPQSDVYKFYQGQADERQKAEGRGQRAEGVDALDACAYKFLHDRVQQAAYSLIPDDQKQSTHLQIGRLLQRATSVSERDEKLFAIVNHLNKGAMLIVDALEQQTLAQLNQRAGQKARSATAYGAALDYCNTGIALLRDDRWQSQYDLTLALYTGAAESAYLSTDFEQMEQLAETVLTHAHSCLDRVNLYTIQIQACIAQNQHLDALRLARAVLQQLGVALPEQPTQADIEQALQRTQTLLSGRSIESLLELPTMTALEQKAVMLIISNILSVAYQVAPDLLPLLIFVQVDLSVQYGNTAESTYGYVMYGVMLIALLGKVDVGYRFGQAGIHLLQRLDAPKLAAKTIFGFNNSLRHWREPAKDTLTGYLQAYVSGLETGDLEYVALSLLCYSYTAYFSGQELSSLRQTMDDHRQVMRQFRQDGYLRIQSIYYQAVLNLLEPTAEPDRLQSEHYDEAAMIQRHLKANQALALYQIYFNKLLLAYLFQRYEQALENARLTEQYLGAAAGLLHIPMFSFYDALVQLAVYPTVSETEQMSILDRVATQQAKLQEWATHAPSNQAHRCALVAAERCRVLGQKAEAIDGYDRAIDLANAHAYRHEAALANELAAKFYLDWNKERLAQDYLIEAYYSYVRWGAKAKIIDLETRYPQLLAPILQQTRSALSPHETIFATVVPSTSTASTSIAASLDFAAVLKASQALSSEIELGKLLSSLLQLIIENAGADKCVLLLKQDNVPPNTHGERLLVKGLAIIGAEPVVLQRIPVEESQDIPLKLVYSVKNRLEPIVLVDATTHTDWLTDPYFQEHHPQSLLCSPIVHQGQLLGIVYLENNVTIGAFTNERVDILNLLCAQTTISLENARLYQRSQDHAQALEQSLANLRVSETRFQTLAANLPGIIYQLRMAVDGSTAVLYISSGCTALYEVQPEDFLTGVRDLRSMEHPDERPAITQAMIHSAQTLAPFNHEWRIMTPSGTVKWVQAASRPERQTDGSIIWDGVQMDISERKRGEAERKQAEQRLQRQAEEDQLLAAIAQTINQSVRLDQVLDGCLEQVRQFFQSDRVLICRFDANYNVVIELEALSQPELALLGQTINDPCFDQGWAERYRQGYVTACNDAQANDLHPCYAALLAQMQVQASLAVGILEGDQIWGLMIVHYCHQPYEWQQSEIDLLKQLGLQLGIANQKAILYAQLEAELSERRRTETALRLSEERYRCLTNVTTQLLWTTDADGQIVEDLPSWRAYTGQSFEEIKDAGAFQALHPQDYEHVLQAWTHAVQTQSPYRLECRVRSTDGSYRYFDVQGVPVFAEDGSIREWIGSCSDIDDRKQAEQQLQASQQLLALVLNTIPHKVFWKDRNLVYQGSNSAFAEVVGFTPTEIVGKSDYDLPWTTAESDWFRECDRQVMESNTSELGIVETTLQADGTTVWIETSKLPLHDAIGTVIGVLGIYQDITDRKRAEQQLQESQQLLALVLDTIPHKVFWKDRDSNLLGWNRAFAEIIGCSSAAELAGKTDDDMPWTTEEADWYRECDRRVMAADQPEFGIIETQLQADGSLAWVETSKVPLHDADGSVIGLLGVYQDITDRKQAEAALQQALQEREQQSRLLQTVLDSTQAWIFAKDRDFRYIMANRSFADAIGQTVEAMLGKDDLELGFPEALVLGNPAQKIRGFRTDDRCVLAGEIIHNPHDPATIADGSLRIFDTRKNPLYDSDGNIFAMLGFCHDVTERKQAETELRASQQRLSLLIQQTPLAVIEWDATLQVRSWNRAAEQIFGFTAAEVLGRTMSFLLPDTTEPLRGDQVTTQLRSQPGGNHSSIKNVTKAGNVILCEWYNNPLVDEAGEIIGMASMVLDITDRHNAEITLRRSKTQLKEKAEELEQTLQELRRTQSQMVQSEKMSGLGQLVAGVAHEINNPVNFIYGNLTHANSYTDDILGLLALYQKHYPTPDAEIQTEVDAIDLDFLLEDLPKLLASMRVGAERIQKIVASLRNFSRMDEAEVKAVNLHDGIDSTLMILQHRLKVTPDHPGIQIIKAYGNLPLVECYAGQLNQVFMNVLSNAIDALEEQMERQSDFQPTITICTALTDSTHVRMSFADNGPGIPDAVKARLFDPFFTTKPVGKGTGMGLSISHQIVTEKHGGSLQCLSTPGQGTKFIIEIPIQS